MGAEMKVEKGNVVSMDYELRLAGGEIVDASKPGAPLSYIHGQGQINPGLERALEGLSIGDARQVVITPAEGYGEHDPRRLREVPRSAFPDDVELTAGARLDFQGPDGRVFRAVVREARPDVVVVDHNHPLAGKELHFAVTVRDVRAARPEELSRGHACTGCGKH
jgi:FKBP-type peptidyl-prolyl cis-trans isomerase SlyD